VIVSAVLLIFPAVMAFAAAMDLLTMRISNQISIALAAAFFVAAPLAGLSTIEILSHAGAGMLVLAAAVALFALGGFGGGDAKLLSAAALWIGFDQLVPFLAHVGIFGGVLAVAVLAFRSIPVLGVYAPDWAMKLHQKGTGIPYGIAIASGALMIYPHTAWFAHATA
jgi:prepilin peptidase CpaA